jgi:hypothetical protein
MLHLAQAVVAAAMFLEFSEDDIVNPDGAVRTLENMASALSGATADEIKALRIAARFERDAHERIGCSAQTLEFFDKFVVNFGLENEGGGLSIESIARSAANFVRAQNGDRRGLIAVEDLRLRLPSRRGRASLTSDLSRTEALGGRDYSREKQS